MYIWVGRVTLWTDIAVGLLTFMALILTVIVGFGLEYMQQQRPSSRALVEMTTELSDIKSKISELAKKVDSIQKELEE